MFRNIKTVIIPIFIAAGSLSANANTTFDFSASGVRNADQSLTYMSNALSVNVTGFFTNDDIAPYTGFTNDNASLRDTSKGIRYNRNKADYAGIDGRDQNELLRFEFNLPVRIERISFTYVEKNDQFDFFADIDNDGIIHNNFIGHYDPVGSPSYYSFGAGSPLASIFGLGAGFTENNDDYSIASITVSAIPEPATWLMMILGFGLIGLQLRSRGKQLAS